MRHLKLILIALVTLIATVAKAEEELLGIPHLRNYSAADYQAHNQNFDIITGHDGTVYVANFEGLLYYDYSSWGIIHTPGITRITAVFRDSKNVIWTGGYNYIGYVEPDERGVLRLHTIDENRNIHGEVQWIWERNGSIHFLVSDEKIYKVTGNGVVWAAGERLPESGFTYIGGIEGNVNQVQNLEDGFKALATANEGLVIINKKKEIVLRINEDNGLCSNNVSHITYNGHGLIWGATDNGIFCVAFPSIYSHFTQNEGLHGEVTAIGKIGQDVYAGTLSGIYRLSDRKFHRVAGINHACWQLYSDRGALLAATSNGVYRITAGDVVSQLTTGNTLSLLIDDDGFISGEMDGVYHTNAKLERRKISDIERVVTILRDKDGTIWIKNLYGKIWQNKDGGTFTPYSDNDEDEINTLVAENDKVYTISANATKPFRFPLFSLSDDEGLLWLTDNKGRSLYAMKDESRDPLWSRLVYPLMDYSVRTLWHDGRILWMGGDKGINIVHNSRPEPSLAKVPNLFIRAVILNNDSVVWGRYKKSQELLMMNSDERHLTFYYSTDKHTLLLPTQYRTRLDNGSWSAWDFDTFEEYPNLDYGLHNFEVQARDAYGRVTEIQQMSFRIVPPFYLRWYMMLVYLLLGVLLVLGLVQWRLYRLNREKDRLEKLVQERTNEVVRLEKMATVGKLTQGLIDRILNPMNYINNFAKLSQGLVKDITANIEDEKEQMDEENYEDTMDALDMLKGNLQKVGEHGASTSRTLKAMEEMLKERTGNAVQMSLNTLLQENMELLRKFYAKDIEQYHIKTVFNHPDENVNVTANIEQLGKTFMSILVNGIYAVQKKAQREKYEPQVTVTLSQEGGKAKVVIHDNGIGIESTIIDKIFDPFFTTKTTGEASGVGLYLSRETIHDLRGDITVCSEKDKFTEFTIIIPN